SIEFNKKKELQHLDQVANLSTYPSQHFKSFCYDDDDDYDYMESTIPLNKIDSQIPSPVAITPNLWITDSLTMEDEHLDTIPATESDEVIKSSVENLVQNPSESKDECECDDSQTTNFSTFSSPLFEDSTSSDDESSHEESYLLESLLNRDTLMASSPKIDSLLDEFSGELITIPLRIVNREHKEYISLLERLLYDNSSPRPPKTFHANPNTIIESLPTFPIPVEDSDSLREEIDIFPGPDDSPGIESDDYDSEGDDNSTFLPKFESFHVDYPDLGDSTIVVVEYIPIYVPNI
ncbi:hypothetical protein Tco_1330969, partial [Tanacetum coccineum]